jgi:DNA adenine methylase Dam
VGRASALQRKRRRCLSITIPASKPECFPRRGIFNGDRPKSSLYTPTLAAKLIYLNRTGFNGLFRLNSQGQFNVPLGRYTNPQICDRENLERVRAALTETRADICQAPFETVLDRAESGDFVYFDPPYVPLSRTSLFTSYTADGFSPTDQRRLQQVTIELGRRGCWVSATRRRRRSPSCTTAIVKRKLSGSERTRFRRSEPSTQMRPVVARSSNT